MFNEMRASNDYDVYDDKPSSYKQTLWNVDHNEFKKPGERFISGHSVYCEEVMSGDVAPLDNAPVPRGMIKFAEWFTKKLGIDSTEYSTIVDVLHRVMSFLDYTEPYYLFTNSCVQIYPNQLKYTYRLKSNGSVLPPKQIEVFQVVKGWDFATFKKVMTMMNHPSTEMVARGEFIKHSRRGDAVTIEDVIDTISQQVWGDPYFLNSWVDEWVESFYDCMPIHAMEDELSLSLDMFQRKDLMFWRATALAALLWFRSEHALPFLCEYHPIYSALLGWNKDTNTPFVAPGSGGEAIIYGWEIYDHRHVIVEPNQPPGSCDCCHAALHCTKLVNAKAVTAPKCSCGRLIDVTDFDLNDHLGTNCREYRTANPPVRAFACQRCLGLLVKGRAPNMACEHSATCPNTGCGWHGGTSMYIRGLTDRRRMLLTQKPQQ